MRKGVSIVFLLFVVFYNCEKKDVYINPIVITTFTGAIEEVDTFGGSKNDGFQAIVTTTDGGYVTLGYTQSIDADIVDKAVVGFDFWVQKFSSSHALVWSKTYGGSQDEKGAKIIETSDGGLALLGFSKSEDGNLSQNNGNQDFWLLKIDTNGAVLWQKTFGFAGADYGTSLIETSDQGFLLTGVLDVSASGGLGNSRNAERHAGGDVWAIKTDADGNFVWSNYYGGSYTDTAYDVVQTPENDFLLIGSSDSNDVDITQPIGSYDFWVFKISNTGNLLWEKSYGGTEIDEARAVTTTHDGNFLIVGDTRSADNDVDNNKGAADLWLLKIDTNGTILWEKTIGGTTFDVARAVAKTPDNGFILVGSSRSSDGDISTNKGQNDALILKTTSEGVLTWETTVGGTGVDFLYDLAILNASTILAVGETGSADGDVTTNKGFTDALLIKIN